MRAAEIVVSDIKLTAATVVFQGALKIRCSNAPTVSTPLALTNVAFNVAGRDMPLLCLRQWPSGCLQATCSRPMGRTLIVGSNSIRPLKN